MTQSSFLTVKSWYITKDFSIIVDIIAVIAIIIMIAQLSAVTACTLRMRAPNNVLIELLNEWLVNLCIASLATYS